VPPIALDNQGVPYGNNGAEIEDVSAESRHIGYKSDYTPTAAELNNPKLAQKRVNTEFKKLIKRVDKATSNAKIWDETMPGRARQPN
jgi:hypothetical protein